MASSKALGRVSLEHAIRTSRNRNIKGWQSVRSLSTVEALAPSGAAPNPCTALPALPTKMLIRSLLVATISSKPYLLIPCLKILSFLSKPGRGFLLNVDKNPIIHAILKKTFYEQFCAGETESETKVTIQQLKDLGFRGVIMTYAKETVFDHRTNTEQGLGIAVLQGEKTGDLVEAKVKKCANIGAWHKGTLDTIDLLAEGDYLAMKLTGAGPTVTKSLAACEAPSQQMLDALDEICTKCKERNVRILIDAEAQRFQWGIMKVTIDLMRKFNRDGAAVVYNTYQAYLKSTPTTLATHLAAADKEGFTLGLKLVRGAYMNSDPRSLIHDTKQDTDNAYNSIAQGALRQEIGDFGPSGSRPFPSVNLFLASHNKASVLNAHSMHVQRAKSSLPTVPVGFGQLQGMSDEVSFGLLQLKEPGGSMPEVYKCSTWGDMSECLAYLLRRAVENRDAVSRTGDEYKALMAEARRRFFSPSAPTY